MKTSSNIYAKLAQAREEFHSLKLKKSGKNTYAGYEYFELADFLIPAMDCLKTQGLVPVVWFAEDYAYMEVFDTDSDQSFNIRSPMREANLKGCHPIQNLGAVETYQRRYLWTMLMEIVEHDALEKTTGKDPVPPAVKKKVAKKAAKKAATPPDTSEENTVEAQQAQEPVIEDEEGAAAVTDMLIDLATNMHADSMKSLIDFWRKNTKVIDKLDHDFKDQYHRLQEAFTQLKQSIKEQAE